MLFTVEMDEVRILLVARRIQRLLQHGWTLADPSRADDLTAQLAAQRAATAFQPETLDRSEPNPETVGDGSTRGESEPPREGSRRMLCLTAGVDAGSYGRVRSDEAESLEAD